MYLNSQVHTTQQCAVPANLDIIKVGTFTFTVNPLI